MAFEYILANLLAETGAAGVLFLDGTGETVDVVCSDFTPYEMRVLGAYLGIYLKQVGTALESWQMGSPRLVHIEKERLHIYCLPLPEGYYLVLVQRRPALVGRARLQLDKAGEQLVASLF
jgi:predicted regulator of Ras-like GTPase activity (Roadblock/LC7/MglB family)